LLGFDVNIQWGSYDPAKSSSSRRVTTSGKLSYLKTSLPQEPES
jgi:hypothetical protein